MLFFVTILFLTAIDQHIETFTVCYRECFYEARKPCWKSIQGFPEYNSASSHPGELAADLT